MIGPGGMGKAHIERIHSVIAGGRHNEIGNGEIAWDEVFGYLRETSYDGPLSVCVFGWEEQADAIHVRMRERTEAELAK